MENMLLKYSFFFFFLYLIFKNFLLREPWSHVENQEHARTQSESLCGQSESSFPGYLIRTAVHCMVTFRDHSHRPLRFIHREEAVEKVTFSSLDSVLKIWTSIK